MRRGRGCGDSGHPWAARSGRFTRPGLRFQALGGGVLAIPGRLDGVARDAQLARDFLDPFDPFALREVRAPDPGDRIHNQHLPHHPHARVA